MVFFLVDLYRWLDPGTADQICLCQPNNHWFAKASSTCLFIFTVLRAKAFVTMLQRLFPADRSLKRPELVERVAALEAGGEFQVYAPVKQVNLLVGALRRSVDHQRY